MSSQLPPQPAAVAPLARYPPLAELYATARSASLQVVKEEPLPTPPAPAAVQDVPGDDDEASPKTPMNRLLSFFVVLLRLAAFLILMGGVVMVGTTLAHLHRRGRGQRGSQHGGRLRRRRLRPRRLHTPGPRQPQREMTLRALRHAHDAQAAAGEAPL